MFLEPMSHPEDSAAEPEFPPAADCGDDLHRAASAPAPHGREHAELDLEDQLTKVAASVPGVICSFRLSPDGRASMPHASPALRELYGLAPEEVADTFDPVLAGTNPDDLPGLWETVATSAQDLSPWHAEFRFHHPTKGEIWIEGHSVPLREADGGTLWHGYLQDITARKHAETQIRETTAALRRERDLLQSVMDGAPNVQLAYLDRDFNFVRVNAAYAESCGYAPADMIGLNHFALYPNAEAEAVFAGVRDIGVPAAFHDRPFIYPDQPTRGLTYWDWVLTPVRDAAGTIEGLVLSLTETTRRKRTEDALKASQEGLLDADRRKDEFLAMLAHELRNPLAPIRNAAHVLSLLKTGEPRVGWAQRMIEQQTGHLSRLVDDLLDVSRFTRGEITLKPILIDFNEVARQVIEGARSQIEAKGHRYALDLPPEPMWLNIDVVRVSQALANLIDNAVKYTLTGGQISLRATAHPDEAEIILEDNGMGIPPELLPYVFDLFQQGRRTLDRSKGGLGLGLTLVRRLVEAHGGRVAAESAGVGAGTRVRLWLPRPRPDTLTPPALTAAEHQVPHLRILVVDDESAVADSTALMLRLDGHSVQIARAGPAALQSAANFRPQVVLLDIGLRGMDGYQTARQLRSRHGNAGVCLIAVTGYGDAQARERARLAGFDHYLVKPVEPGQLKALLATVQVAQVPDAPADAPDSDSGDPGASAPPLGTALPAEQQ